METRIKVKNKKNGTSDYYPQYKGWFLWHNFAKWVSFSFMVDVSYSTLEEAKAHIDGALEYEKKKNGEKVVSTEYIKYP